MANIQLPADLRGYAIQALAPDTNATVAIGAASAAVSLPTGSEVVRISASCNCFLRFGATATGSDMVFNAGSEVFRVPAGATQVAAIQNGAVTGTLSVTRLV